MWRHTSTTSTPTSERAPMAFSAAAVQSGWETDWRARGDDQFPWISPSSRLEAPAGPEDPGQNGEAQGNEQDGEPEAGRDADIAPAIEAPTEAADEIDHGIEQADGAPERRQHVDRIEGAAEEGERRHHQRGNDRELLEGFGPNPDDKAEKAERDRGQHEERDHPQRVVDPDRREQRGGQENDEPDADRLGRRRADIGRNRLDRRQGRREDFINRAGEFGK